MPRQRSFRELRPDVEARQQEIDRNRTPIVLVLDQLRDRRNLGLIVRLAEAARLEAVYLLGGKKEVAVDPRTRRIARFTHTYVPVHAVAQQQTIQHHHPDYTWVGLEITDNAVPVHRYQPPGPLVLVTGNEQHGVSDQLLEMVDTCVYLPMLGMNTSMNVAMATGIAVYRLAESLGFLDRE